MPEDTILCWTWPSELSDMLTKENEKRHVTVKDCGTWLDEGKAGRKKLAAFFRQRMHERYIAPVSSLDSNEKNGFSIMAISCLLIESFEAFRQGWDSTEKDGRSPLAFCYFFDRETRFHDFKGYAREFYKHVRCGILHQGETTNGWTIRRDKDLFDSTGPRVNATEFYRLLEDVVNEYAEGLKSDNLSEETWAKFSDKVRAILKHCERRNA